MILVAVGTFLQGFDALVEAADAAAGSLGVGGFAQIGHSAVVPRHLAWERFLPPEALRGRIAATGLVVCHGGIGLLGDAMRAGKPIVVVPRRGRPTRACPAGDQTALAWRLARVHPIRVCERPEELGPILRSMLAEGLAPCRYAFGTDIPALVAGFLGRTAATAAPQSRPTSSS